MSIELVLYAQDRLAEVRTWANLHPTERRRRCLAALRDRDTATLQDLLIAYLNLTSYIAQVMHTQLLPSGTVYTVRYSLSEVRAGGRIGVFFEQPGQTFEVVAP